MAESNIDNGGDNAAAAAASHPAIDHLPPIITNDVTTYNAYIEVMRQEQYPMIKDTLFLDHAGTSIPSKAQLDAFHRNLLDNLYGNLHSANISSQTSSFEVVRARSGILQLFNADPDDYDVVFTANATAAIKLVGEALRELDNGFSYGYHVDSHTSIIGLRELSQQAQCLTSENMTAWIEQQHTDRTALFAYPAQSNMNGKRLPLDWCRRLNQVGIYTMLDAAAYASTTPLHLDAVSADFTVVSLYKIFGFPDLGALIVKKSAGHLLQRRRYFGGGTVDMITCAQDPWHMRKSGALHEHLEDGTLPIHNIVALNSAMSTFDQLFGNLKRVSDHTMFLARRLHQSMLDLRHANGRPVCKLYSLPVSSNTTPSRQGPIVAFNLLDHESNWVSTTEVDKLATIKNIQLRTGSVCNPGGVATALDLSSAELRENFSAGYRCGNNNELMNGKPTGIVRVSLGAISTISDVDRFVSFIKEYFVTRIQEVAATPSPQNKQLQIESLTIYPVKSCAGWSIPYDTAWQVYQEGLAWDREWCIVQAGTGVALSQKQYPKMALIRPEIDIRSGDLRIHFAGSSQKLAVPLIINTTALEASHGNNCLTNICGDTVSAHRYLSSRISKVLSTFLGVACTLARFPVARSGQHSPRHSKDHVKTSRDGRQSPLPLLLSNESPILTVTRSSLDAVNEALKARGKPAAHHSVFRANIILAELASQRLGAAQPWEEDNWNSILLSGDGSTTAGAAAAAAAGPRLRTLGGCRRCQMVCVDQLTGEKRSEVFLTLAKQRRIGGKVLFGIHCTLADETTCSIKIGDIVQVSS